MKTIKVIIALIVVILMTSCAGPYKNNGLHSNKNQKPVPVTPGPMTRSKPNIFGHLGPGSFWEIDLFPLGQYRRNEPDANGKIVKKIPKRKKSK